MIWVSAELTSGVSNVGICMFLWREEHLVWPARVLTLRGLSVKFSVNVSTALPILSQVTVRYLRSRKKFLSFSIHISVFCEEIICNLERAEKRLSGAKMGVVTVGSIFQTRQYPPFCSTAHAYN